MKVNSIIVAAFAGITSASPTLLQERQGGSAASGDGPYGPISVSTDSALANHAIYIPTANTGTAKLPVLVWGEGGCTSDGSSNARFLNAVASYGYLVVASGAPGGRGTTTAAMMTASIDFAVKVAGTGRYVNIDATKVMAAGFSCGGVEAMAMSWDPRVKTIGIFSSGLLTNYTTASTFTKPIIYIIGGSNDVAYQNAERDFKALPAGTPAWKGNLPLGHGGDLNQANGGKFGRAGIAWMEFLFRGNQTAKNYFLADGYKVDGWDVQTHALDQLKPIV
ncbi:alpha/beta-hydrolase [Staphylotrichum tortipilum]|uniref:Alpha/beta-hydrolase n=1 Tax=Staphylotrichum tortipilum TaxID=2831512 RepID=A0AAN6MPK0_9PEZI|nr:alpha/beta-hydrolase [Staphylotrichum longicolle]